MNLSPSQKTLLTPHFTDTFADEQSSGDVIGSLNPAGILRQGLDAEGVISIDNNALRIQPMIEAGWGRCAIAYGPFKHEAGLTFGVFMLNGHNTSQTGDINQSVTRRLLRWMRGSGSESLTQRLWHVSKNCHKKTVLRELRRWKWLNGRYRNTDTPTLDENLAVGWFSTPVPEDPRTTGHAYVMHALGAENGELWARVQQHLAPLLPGLQNVPFYFLIVLRPQGAAYYISSVPAANDATHFPNMRLLAIDLHQHSTILYAGLQQSCLGQIGFRVDTRVYAVQVAKIPQFANWYGTAHAADSLGGSGSLAETPAEIGGEWTIYQGAYRRTKNGCFAQVPTSLAILDADTAVGFLHILVDTAINGTGLGLVWRFQDEANLWQLWLSETISLLQIQIDGVWHELACTHTGGLVVETTNSVQILDDGKRIAVFVNGRSLFDTWFVDTRLANATGIGIQSGTSTNLNIHHIEAHPRQIPIPSDFKFDAFWLERGSHISVADNFTGTAGPLAGHTTNKGVKAWFKQIGTGDIDLNGNGRAKVRASQERPNPDRTAYTIAWDNPTFADIQVTLTPPGNARGQWENGRGGFIFWQDAHNYIIVSTWLDDFYDGASISSFFQLDGFEDLYNAVWTNVGGRIDWGIPYELRVVFDGMNYAVYLNAELVLYRALTDVSATCSHLKIRRVGIVANWEWGNDTGTVFENFIARDR